MSPPVNIAILIALIVLYGYAQPRFITRHYTAANLIFALVALGFAGLSGASFKNLGFEFSAIAIGLSGAVILVTIATAAAVVKRYGLKFRPNEFYELLVRIPFGTALSEELIFRAALLGLVLQHYSHLSALLISSLAFGLWHILPGQTWANGHIPRHMLASWLGKSLPGAATIAFTGLAGLLFGGLRLITGSFLVPWSFHTFTNVAGQMSGKTNWRIGGYHAKN